MKKTLIATVLLSASFTASAGWVHQSNPDRILSEVSTVQGGHMYIVVEGESKRAYLEFNNSACSSAMEGYKPNVAINDVPTDLIAVCEEGYQRLVFQEGSPYTEEDLHKDLIQKPAVYIDGNKFSAQGYTKEYGIMMKFIEQNK
ncbi:hypothetical protein [Vibrio paucivorans]|uniref:Uncharacterized protein n=1 Tax=Vibrio paucivorans TaxID=2829489 RepID=A0A9X3CDK2_9VIBR|nr:hypothetical protein [Vibrio paucivorans]MCW8333803.1 hypothetical protein [Vibrio paucivorans]